MTGGGRICLVVLCIAEAFPSVCSLNLRGPSSLLADQYVADEALQSWLKTFVAADPSWQQWCERKIAFQDPQIGHGTIGSQIAQDIFLFRNLYAAKAMRGERGFYVESGANHWSEDSNTLFFDKCLGWGGICVEPNAKYIEGLKANRSCHVFHECISETEGDLVLQQLGTLSTVKVAAQGKGKLDETSVHCRSLPAFMQDVGASKVDLWVLDVEGHEMSALKGASTAVDNVDVIVMENLWGDMRSSEHILSDAGYMKYAQMPADGVYIRRGRKLWTPQQVPEQWNLLWDVVDGYRKHGQPLISEGE